MNQHPTTHDLIIMLANTCQHIVPQYITPVCEDDPTLEIFELVILDFTTFLCWLACIDTHISKQELKFINEAFPNASPAFTEADVLKTLDDFDCLGNNFLTLLPCSYIPIVKTDNELYKENPDGNINLISQYYEIFRAIGEALTYCDSGDPNANSSTKQKALADFLFMLASYENRHSLRTK